MSVRNGGVLGMLAATTCSTAGNAVVMVAVPFIVLQRTGSATLAGAVGAAALAPQGGVWRILVDESRDPGGS
jgi:hypothetical protein